MNPSAPPSPRPTPLLPTYTFRSLEPVYTDCYFPLWCHELAHKKLVQELERIRGTVSDPTKECSDPPADSPPLWSQVILADLESRQKMEQQRDALSAQRAVSSPFSSAPSRPPSGIGTWHFQGSQRLGVMSIYGKTMQGRSSRIDVPFYAYFFWRFPDHMGRDDCMAVWEKLRKVQMVKPEAKWGGGDGEDGGENSRKPSKFARDQPPWKRQKREEDSADHDNSPETITLDSLVYFTQFVLLEDGQRFDFWRGHPHLRLHFRSKQAMRLAHTLLDQYIAMGPQVMSGPVRRAAPPKSQSPPVSDLCPKDFPVRRLYPLLLGLPHLASFDIHLFESKIQPVYLWNRHWYNPNAWLSLNRYFQVDDAVRDKTTTCRDYMFTAHPIYFTWHRDRVDLPPIVIKVLDYETQGKDPFDPGFKILTSSEAYIQMGGQEMDGKPSPPKLLDMVCLTWQPSLEHMEGVDPDHMTIFQESCEAELLKRDTQLTRDKGVDIIVTHNGNQFDMIAKKARIEALGMKDMDAMGKDLREHSRIRRKGQDGDFMGVSHAGILHVDTLVFYKSFFGDLRSKALKYLLKYFFDNEENKDLREHLDREKHAQTHKNPVIRQFCSRLPQRFLINSKQDVHYSRVAPLFFSKDPKQVTELLEYNFTDVFQTARLMLLHNIIPVTSAFATVFEISANVYYSQGSEIKCMSRLWREIFRDHQLYNVYEHPEYDKYLYSTPQVGAIVQKAIPGIYRALPLLDVKSMYPSMILEYILCKCTIREKRFCTPEDLRELEANWSYRIYNVQGEDLVVVDGRKDGSQMCHSGNSRYVQGMPFIPRTQMSLKDERSRYKKKVTQYKAEGNSLMADLYTAMEKAVKVLMNSLYGLNVNQGTNICAISELQYTTRQQIQARLDMYLAVAKKLAQKKGAQDRQLMLLYRANAQTCKQILMRMPGDAEVNEEEQREQERTTGSLMAFFRGGGGGGAKKQAPPKPSYVHELIALQRKEREVHLQIVQTRQQGGYWSFWALGALITYLGRCYIETTKTLVKSVFPQVVVPYGDTDSLLMELGHIIRSNYPSDEAFEIAIYEETEGKVLTLINDYWKRHGCQRGFIEMESEAIYHVLVLGSKKKYYFGSKAVVEKTVDAATGAVSYNVTIGDIKISGLEMKKRNMAPWLRRIQAVVVKLVASNKIAEAVEKTKSMMLDVIHERVPIDELVMVQLLNQNPEEMINLSSAAAVALRNQRTGRGLATGKQEMSFVFVRNGKRGDQSATTELVMDVAEAKETGAKLNYPYYVSHHFKKPVCKLFEPIVPRFQQMFESWVQQTVPLDAEWFGGAGVGRKRRVVGVGVDGGEEEEGNSKRVRVEVLEDGEEKRGDNDIPTKKRGLESEGEQQQQGASKEARLMPEMTENEFIEGDEGDEEEDEEEGEDV